MTVPIITPGPASQSERCGTTMCCGRNIDALAVQPLDHGEVALRCGGVDGLPAVVVGGGEGHALRVQLLHTRQVTGQGGESQRVCQPVKILWVSGRR